MNKLLIIEDDKKLNDGIYLTLRNNEDVFVQCRTLADAKEEVEKQELNLIILDLNLPDGNGIDFLKWIRKKSSVPVIILTANNMETDIVTGLELGADDYITKPFSLMVLRARVNVQLRKQSSSDESIIKIDDFIFDFNKMQYSINGELIELSKTEQRLLKMLIANKGMTLSRSSLIEAVWNGDIEYVDEHALTVTIKRLRDKLQEDSTNPKYIKTVYGLGYTWAVK